MEFYTSIAILPISSYYIHGKTMCGYYEANFVGRAASSMLSLINALGSCPWPTLVCGFPNLYMEQFLSQLTMLLQYGDKLEDTTGLLIQAVIKAMKLETDLVGELFQTPLVFKDLVTDMSIKWLWLDCVHFRIEMHTKVFDFPILCSGDIELMWLFAQHRCCFQDLSTLNWCRMALKAIWLSDICMGSGREVTQSTWEG